MVGIVAMTGSSNCRSVLILSQMGMVGSGSGLAKQSIFRAIQVAQLASSSRESLLLLSFSDTLAATFLSLSIVMEGPM